MAGYILSALAFTLITLKQISDDIKDRNYFLPGIFLMIIFYLVFQIGNPGFSVLSYESTQEATAGLNALKESDWNYTGTGYIGYPVKAYILNAIPSVLLGRSFFALNLGFAIPFLTGLILLFIEIRKYLKFKNLQESLALLPVIMIVFFPYVNEYYHIFEQTITPVGYAMIVIALFFRAVRRSDLLTFLMLSWNACMLPFIYTPALAFMELVSVIGICTAVMTAKGRSVFNPFLPASKRWYITSVITVSVTPLLFFACTLIKKREDRFLTTYNEEIASDRYGTFIKSFMKFFTDSNSLFFGIFGALVLFYIVSSLLMRFRIHDLVISLWCIGTALFSFLLPGAAARFDFEYDPNVLAQRNMVTVPVLAVSMFIILSDYIRRNSIAIRKDFVAIISAVFLIFGLSSLTSTHKGFNYMNYSQSMKYIMTYLQEAAEYHGLGFEDEITIVIHSENNLYEHPIDYTCYFFPNAKVYKFGTSEYGGISIYDTIFPRLIISDSENTAYCYGEQFKTRSFRNRRYGADTTLYFRYMDPDYSYVSQFDEDYIEQYNLQEYV